jgi:hypothetical protein
MSMIKTHLEDCLAVWPHMKLFEFLVRYGREYHYDPARKVQLAPPQQCYRNAATIVQIDRALTYVEGKVTCCGVPIDHAWCVDAAGEVVEITIDPANQHEPHREYFGVPFRTEYVRAAALTNKYYGLLDGLYARKTLPKLVELGLEGGQWWLLNRNKLKKAFALLLTALLLPPGDLRAEQVTTYRDGRVVARTVTSPGGAAVTYGADGRVVGRATTSPSTGVTTVYGSDGRRLGTVEGGRR